MIVKKCKHRRNGKAVVTTERCTLSREKTVLLDQAQRLCCKVVTYPRTRDTHHIEVSLKQDGGMRLITAARRLFDKDIIHFVAIAFKPARRGKGSHVVGSSAFISGAARYLRKLLEKMKKALGVSSVNDILHNISIAPHNEALPPKMYGSAYICPHICASAEFRNRSPHYRNALETVKTEPAKNIILHYRRKCMYFF